MNSAKSPITVLQRFQFLIGVIHRMLIGFVNIYVTWLCLRKPEWADVPWHAVLCTIGFNLLMAEGLICYCKGNSTTHGCYQNGKIGLHITLQLVGSIMGIAGIGYRIGLEEQHFKTTHGQLGLATLVLCSFSLLCGLSALFSVKIKDHLRVQPVFNKVLHSLLGIATFTTATICLLYGFDTKTFMDISPADPDARIRMRTVLRIATIGGLILTIYGPLEAAAQRTWNYFR